MRRIIVENLIGNSTKQTEVQAESSNGQNSAVAFARAKEISQMIPQLNEEEISEEIPELPENPTEEQLYKYAESHPLVKKGFENLSRKNH